MQDIMPYHFQKPWRTQYQRIKWLILEAVFYRSIYGGELTGYITGQGNNEDVTSQVGGLE